MFKFVKKQQFPINFLNQLKRFNTTCVKHPNDSVLFRQVRNYLILFNSIALLNGIILTKLVDNETYTYTYILACKQTRNAVIIDPVIEKVERDYDLIKQLKLNLLYASRKFTIQKFILQFKI